MRTRSPFNLKTILTGSLLSVLLAVMAQYSVNVYHTDYLALDHIPAGGVFLFFVLCILVNPLLKRLTRRRFCYSTSELLVIYVMLLMVGTVAEVGLAGHFLPKLAHFAYFATPVNRWEEHVLPYLKDWLVPKDMDVISGFYEGGVAVPWGYWLKFAAPWLAFFLVLYVAQICIATLFRKQWSEHEHLNFALNRLPVAMAEDSQEHLLGAIYRNKLMWLGFGIAFLLSFSVVFHHYLPFIPAFKKYVFFPIFRNTTQIMIAFSFPIIGFIFFVDAKLSFSLWFFAVLFILLQGFFRTIGFGSGESIGSSPAGPFFSHLCFGALTAYVVQTLFFARGHLRDVARKAFGRGKCIDDSRELLSYPVAFWALAASYAFMVLWLRLAGMTVWVAALLVLLVLVVLLGLTKVVAQGGLLTVKAPSLANQQMVSMIGSDILGPENVSNLGLSHIFHCDTRSFPLVAGVHGIKLGERIKGSIRPLFGVMMLALVIGIIASNVVLLKLAYEHGGLHLNYSYFLGFGKYPGGFVANHIMHPRAFVLSGVLFKLLGFGSMLLLVLAHTYWIWFPLHPIGLAIAASYRVMFPWFSIFLGWLFHVAILKYGGPRLFNDIKPFFIGLILGTYAAAGVWFLVTVLFGLQTNLSVFYV